MERRQHDRLTHPGRRGTDRRLAAADRRRVLLLGQDEPWRLLATYLFEEAGYTAYAAASGRQAVAFTIRLLPDVVVVQVDTPETLEVLLRLSEDTSTCDIPVVVLSTSLQSIEARRARAAGGVTLLPHASDLEVLVGEVDTLLAVGPRVQRTLRRRLIDLQELARYYVADADGQARLRRLVDHLQVAIFAVDTDGHCVAASEGATTLTGYSRVELLTTSVFQTVFARAQVSKTRWQELLAHRQYAGTTTITNHAGEDVAIHAAAVAEILPGLHVAALAAVDPRAVVHHAASRPSLDRRDPQQTR